MNSDPLRLQGEVTSLLAEVTRYPMNILTPEAHFENDLGIDSLKLAELASRIRNKYGLTSVINYATSDIINVRTLAQELSALINQSTPTLSTPPIQAPLPKALPIDWVESITAAVQKVTRYPRSILTVDAHFENDLGIDSLKLNEIYAELRTRTGLGYSVVFAPEQTRSIGALAKAVNELKVERTEILQSPTSRPKSQPKLERVFAGKIALVTGSGRGIGFATAKRLAELGATVIVNSFHSREQGEEAARQIRESGGEAKHIWASVANEKHVATLFEEIESDFGKLDFFLANAANGLLSRLNDVKPSDWELAFRTNVIGFHLCATRAARLMGANGGGKILALSTPGSQRHIEYYGFMGAIKAAVEALSRSLAVELAPLKIQVNTLSLGPVDGDLLRKFPEYERLEPHWRRLSLGGDFASNDDVAGLISMLLRDEFKFVNGSVITSDGGFSIQI